MSWYKKAAYQEDYVEEVIIPNEVSRESKDNVLKIKTDDEVAVIEYKKVYAWKNDPGAGFAFPCTPDGEVIEDKMHPSALENLNKCRDNPDDFIVTLEKRIDIERLCNCGSGEVPYAEYDARGIFLDYVCPRCKDEKLSKFRRDVLTDPGYWADEPIEPEEY